MYELVEKNNVPNELNNGATLYVVDIPTQRVINCSDMTISAVRSFQDKPEVMFFKVVSNE